MKIKNGLILSTYIISMLPTIFYGSNKKLNLGLFVEVSTRIDFFVYYYCISVSFIIYAYCLHFPKGIDKRVTKLILIITILDIMHLTLFAMQGFGISKIGIAFLILVLLEINKKMGKIKLAYKLLEGFGFSFSGLSFINLINLVDISFLKEVDEKIQTLSVIAGIVALAFKIRHSFLLNKVVREEKRIENLFKLENLEQLKWENDEKKNPIIPLR